MVDFTLLVVTNNRAVTLRDTLAALPRQTYSGSWEVLVVDNNSTDGTTDIVAEAMDDYPVPLRYAFEPRPGKYWAMNTGIEAANGSWIACTDDDAFPDSDWLTQASAGFAEYGCDFVGGRVLPLFRGTPPDWIDLHHPVAGKVLALQDHGSAPREYGRGGMSWPLGVNVAYRRDAFARAGVFDGRLGRVAGTLRNQSQREWHLRARAAGLRGMYLPGMKVHHLVDQQRLTPRYFYRWFYWHGISRAILNRTTGAHLLDPEGGTTHAEPHVLGVPASLWRDAACATFSASRRRLCGKRREAFEYELLVCFWAGVLRQRVRDRAHFLSRRNLDPGVVAKHVVPGV